MASSKEVVRNMTKYLEGFAPYKEEIIKAYTENGGWLNLTYGDLLDRAAVRHPDRVAVIDEKHRLTYKSLKEKVVRFAIALLDLGVKKYDRIILQLPNRYEFVVAFYAMQKIGAIPLLAVPRHGYQEIASFAAITEPTGWIIPAKDGKVELIPLIEEVLSTAKGIKHIIMPRDGESLPAYAHSMEALIESINFERYPGSYLDSFRPDPNDVAVLLPTGGTTGLPKVVPRTHNSLIVTNQYISARHHTSDAILLQATPVGHAMAMQGGVNCAMFSGSTLVLQAIPRPTEILETIQRERVTSAFMVPTQLEGIINHPDLERYDLRSLKVIGTAGAGLPVDVAQKAISYLGKFNCKFSGNGLGASEGLLALGDLDDPLELKMKTVGRNVTPGSHYKVVDLEERELGTHVEGELVAKGPEVFTGYYKGTEEERREVFTHDGYYRTGDLAKIDEHGYITITGRRKDTIIRGGETLVPSEMENLIRKHPDVERVAVVGMTDPQMGERACAFVVPKPGSSLTFEGMIRFLRSHGAGVLLLPERLEIVNRLPETGIGKVDKKALKKDIEEKLRKERTGKT
jgi:non-ribosomal peptide synthetase component E (peptide arylation enzyme)